MEDLCPSCGDEFDGSRESVVCEGCERIGQDKKAEVVAERVADALEGVKKELGDEVELSMESDAQRGLIVIRVT